MFEATTKSYKSPWLKNPYWSIRTIINYISPWEDVLDVWCANWYLKDYLPNNNVWWVDWNSIAIDEAKEKLVDAKIIDLNSVPKDLIFNRKFDVIVFADVLEHLLDPQAILSYFKKNLKENWKIIISLPNIALWRCRLNLLLWKFDYTDYGVMDRTHLHLYTFKTAAELIQSSWLSLVSQYGAANLLGFIVHYLPFLKSLFAIHVISIVKHNEK